MYKRQAPLNEAEIIEMQLKATKRKKSSTGFKIKRKRGTKFKINDSKPENQIESKKNLETNIVNKINLPTESVLSNQNNSISQNLENFENSNEESLEEDCLENKNSRWVIPSGWKLILFIKFRSNFLIETSDLFIFDNYEGVYNGFHKGFPLKVKGQTSYPTVDRNPSVIFLSLIHI